MKWSHYEYTYLNQWNSGTTPKQTILIILVITINFFKNVKKKNNNKSLKYLRMLEIRYHNAVL